MSPRRTPAAPPPARRLVRLLRGIGALIVLIAVVVGVPALMAALHLVPHGVPSLHEIGTDLRRRDNGQLVAVVLAAGVWICWGLFTISLIPEIAAAVRKKPARTLPGLGVLQRPAGSLVAAVAIAFTIAPLIAGVATAARANAAPVPLLSSSPPTSTAATPAAHTPTTAQPAAATPQHDTAADRATTPGSAAGLPRYEVRRRDTLWGIAERYLHDPLRYPEIAHLNPTLVGPDNEIAAGSVLTLPGDATGADLIHTPATHEVSVQVKPGDTLYGVEERITHDGDNWVQGFAANRGRVEPGGERFTDPDLIKPGWTVDIPVTTPPPASGAPAHLAPTPGQGPTSTPTRQPHPKHNQAQPTHSPAPARPAEPTPEGTAAASPAPARPAEHEADRQPVRSSSDAPVLAFAGGGLLLAGVSLTALIYYRRRQFQRRNPGRTIGGSPPDLIRMERTVLAAGTVGSVNVTWLDEALRSLVQSVAAQPGGRLPDVIAVRLTESELSLVLTGPAPDAPAPWRVEADGTRWTIQRGDRLPYDAERRDAYFAPFPTLTSVGYTEAGEHWMLDLERIAALSLCGDVEHCLNLARFLAAELAHNTWSEMLQVTLVGFGQELVAANPDRLAYTDDLPGATRAVTSRLESVATAMRTVDTDVLTGRLHDIVGDQWAPQVLLIAPHLAKDTAGLDELLAAMRHQYARASVALVLVDDSDRADAARWQLRVDSAGMLSIPALGLELIAQQIPAAEAAPLAQMLAWAAVCEDEPIPPAHGDEPWDRYADACGGLTMPDGTAPEDAREDTDTDGVEPEPDGAAAPRRPWAEAAAVPVPHLAESAPWANSILPLSRQTYLDRAATTLKDLRTLAPVVDDRIRAQVEEADPDLDRDYADWFDDTCTRPKIRLLGRPEVRAQGSLPERSPQLTFHTEAVVLLTSRTNGLLSSEYAELMWPNDPDVVGKPKVRQSITNLRRWLGRDEQTGEEYVPAWAFEGRAARYLIQKAIRDAELFRRLRVRAVARGTDGLEDLWKALNLVAGPPFAEIPIRRLDDRGPGGWMWLTDANQRLDFEYQAMIVDTAHVVADRHLGDGEPELAARAAQVALRGGTYDNVPLLDLVAACLAQEKDAEAESHVQQMLSNAGVEREEDLDPRTYEVLVRLRRRWRQRAS